ncbi:MAG: ShlB/FhaC/HecB family hemolysin secretion/activation protein [Gammaproteobacteria bacterium]|nr:ShlB/FhaC/HecB family hemolysin secretion/activation protein [Gammaproteobacteria bacterium]
MLEAHHRQCSDSYLVGLRAALGVTLMGLWLVAGAAAAQLQSPEATADPRDTETPSSADTTVDPSFDIWEFRVSGNTLLETTRIERTVYPHLGPERGIEDVEAARRDLEALFRSAGYPTVVVNIPEQDASDGVIDLEIVQGTIDRLRISNSRYFSLGRIREKVPALAEGNVPHFPQVQAELADLNRASADRQVTPILRKGRKPGGVEVDLQVRDRFPLHASLELNDRNSQDTSRLRASATLRYANLWQREHSVSMTAQVSPQNSDDVKVLAGTYVMPLENRDLLALFAVRSESDVATSGDLSVIGSGTILGARYIMPLPAAGNYFHSLTLGADYKDFDEAVKLIGADRLTTPIDYSKFMAEYQGTRVGDERETSFKLAAHFGVRGAGNREFEFENKRFEARPNFFYVQGGFGHTETLAAGAQLYLAANAQLAGGPLVSNEQFSVGGVDSVRGYYESQTLGDDGVHGQLELRSPSLASSFWENVQSLRLFAFLDGGMVRVQDRLPGQPHDQSIYGAGLGLRMQGTPGLSAQFNWAWPLKANGQVERLDGRGHFQLQYEM